jgi:flagellar biosynthetic protein FliR
VPEGEFGWLESVLLASTRIIAFLVIAPPFSYGAIPKRVRAMLGLGLALAVSSTLPRTGQAYDTGVFVETLVAQVLIGVVLGFLVQLAFSAIQSAGGLIDLFGGFQLAQGYDPQSLVNGAQFTRLFQMTALALLFTTDGYQMVIGGVARSFTAIPLGGLFDVSLTAKALTQGLTDMFVATVQIAGPLILVLFLADVGLGLLTRIAPALNAFSMGFPLKILITIMFSATAFVLLPGIVSSLMTNGVQMLQGVK